jgi:ABC-type proline/glycine betaine transport system ATPase subunit
MRDDILLLFFHEAALLSLSSLDSVDRDEASVKIMSISEKNKKVVILIRCHVLRAALKIAEC